jgi:DNA-binding LytR/AlgR family response regulator
MKCLIIDDNEIARTTLAQLVSQVDDLTVSAECSNAMEAYNFIQKNPVDLFFLDIEMPGMTGLELTRNLADCCPVIIFTTSNKEYALEAFELNVADYLLKPVTTARFLQAVSKARDILNSQEEEVKATTEEFIFIRDSNVIRRLNMNDILYAEALGDYVKLYTTEKMYAIHNTLKSVEERLPSDKFLRIHRSFIVALNKIDTLQDGAVVIGRKPLPVADSYRKALNQKMNVL